MHLMGWKNIETGEIKSPYEYVRRTGLSQHGEELNMFAFSGIHSFSPRLFPLMERFPERFPIIDFYPSLVSSNQTFNLWMLANLTRSTKPMPFLKRIALINHNLVIINITD